MIVRRMENWYYELVWAWSWWRNREVIVAPTLNSTQQISEDLHEVGVLDWFLHVISKNEAGLKREHLHSSNYLETTDIIRDGLIGANLGFILAVIAAGLVMVLEPFGPDAPAVIYFFVVVVFTLFGAWVPRRAVS